MELGRKLAFGLLALAAIGIGIGIKTCRDSVCGSDLQGEVTIPDTPWVARASAFRCSTIGDGTTEVIAANRITGKELPIISFRELTTVKLRAESPFRLTVILDNNVDIKEIHDSVDGIAIVYDYQPANDPEARAFYKFSRENWNEPRVKSDPRNKKEPSGNFR